MYVGIDIGGTKTLVTVLNPSGKIVEQFKFPTPLKYSNFLLELAHTMAHFKHQDFKAAAVAAPSTIDRKHGLALAFGNLPWKRVPLQADCETILKCPVVIENDANLAGLGEALVHPKSQTVLYITVSTGIGCGVIQDGVIAAVLADIEAGQMELPFHGKLTKWEHFASGKAIYEHFNKKAMDIHDEASWRYVVRNLAVGFFELMAIVQPDLIIIGGSVGTYFDRYESYLHEELLKHEIPSVPLPKIVQAKHPEEAVIYGCYALIKQKFPHHAATA
jgi:predicted NBD/HSP70 family sugar kinase